MYVFYIKVKRFRPGRKYFFDNIIISHLESISYRLAIDELLVPVAADVGNHGFVDAVGPCSNIEAAPPVQVGEDGADLVKVVVVHEVVVTEMSPPPPKKVERILCTDCKQKPGEPVFYTQVNGYSTHRVYCAVSRQLC